MYTDFLGYANSKAKMYTKYSCFSLGDPLLLQKFIDARRVERTFRLEWFGGL